MNAIYLKIDQIHIDRDETEEINFKDIDVSRLFLMIKEEEDGIPF